MYSLVVVSFKFLSSIICGSLAFSSINISVLTMLCIIGYFTVNQGMDMIVVKWLVEIRVWVAKVLFVVIISSFCSAHADYIGTGRSLVREYFYKM